MPTRSVVWMRFAAIVFSSRRALNLLPLGRCCQKFTRSKSGPGCFCHPGSGYLRLAYRQLGLAGGEAALPYRSPECAA